MLNSNFSKDVTYNNNEKKNFMNINFVITQFVLFISIKYIYMYMIVNFYKLHYRFSR